MTPPPEALKLKLFPITVDWASQSVALDPEASTPVPLPSASECVSERLVAEWPELDETLKPTTPLAATLSVTATMRNPLPNSPSTMRPVGFPENPVRSMAALMPPEDPVWMSIPPWPLSLKYELDTASFWVVVAFET